MDRSMDTDAMDSAWRAMSSSSTSAVDLLNRAREKHRNAASPEEAAFWSAKIEELVERVAMASWTFQIRQ
jgi:hypothetical protein